VTSYLLDTTALIDFSKGFPQATRRITQLLNQGNDLGVCAINITEFYAGIVPGVEPQIDAFLEALAYWPITRATAQQAGIWRHDYARRGQTLSTTDTLVAATAQSVRAVVLTDNIKHYPMPEVQVESIRS